MKQCKTCGITKPLVDFGKAIGYSGGLRPQCRECYRLYQKEQRKKITPEMRREWWVKHKYGLSTTDYQKLLNSQNGLCAICRVADSSLCVDHDHNTGAIRGILCNSCNTGLGAFTDNPDTLSNAITYLNDNGRF